MKGYCVLVGGADRTILVGGRSYTFEDHPHFGPCPLTTKGKELDLGPRSPFWAAATAWIEQGRRLAEDGTCVWDPPPDPFAGLVHLGGRHWTTPEIAARLGLRRRAP
jgi:hypothetical protein